MNDKRGPNDLEAIIERLKFRNEKLHKFNKRIITHTPIMGI